MLSLLPLISVKCSHSHFWWEHVSGLMRLTITENESQDGSYSFLPHVTCLLFLFSGTLQVWLEHLFHTFINYWLYSALMLIFPAVALLLALVLMWEGSGKHCFNEYKWLVYMRLLYLVQCWHGWFTSEKQHGEFQRFSRDCVFVEAAWCSTKQLWGSGFFCLGLGAMT